MLAASRGLAGLSRARPGLVVDVTLAIVAYAIPEDPDMLDGRWRATFERGLHPVGKGLHRARVNADALTLVGLAFSVATAFLIAHGRLGLAVVGVVLTGVPDILDGTVARHSGKAGPRGAFFDSVCDRVSDAVLLGGVAWFLAADSAYLPMLAFAAVALSMLISYERAKAEALGFSAKGGIMERAERLVLLAVGLAFDVLVPVLWLMVVLSAVTALHRFLKVWLQATEPAKPVPGGAPVPTRLRRLRHPRRSRADGLELAGAPPPRRFADWWAARRPDRGERVRSRPRRRTRP
jgi:CDP-diacylglycerol---glycerol-3-phosphate 3-phosphatidyltransferase